MAVLTVEENRNKEGTQGQFWQRTYTRSYTVTTDGPYDGALSIMSSLPYQIGAYYVVINNVGTVLEHDFGSFVNEITARCNAEDGCSWECTVKYAPYNPSNFPKNPLQWPPKITGGTTKFERPCDQDVNGDAILNSAGDYFDPPLSIDDSRIAIKIQVSVARFDPSIIDTYKDAISADTFFGRDPGTWKVAGISFDLEYNMDCGTPDGFYYVVTWEFEYRSEGWETQILDQGLKILDGSDNLVVATDANGKDLTSPVLLDGDGGKLASGDDPVFLTFEVYNKVPFQPLGLDPNGAPGQS
jgi:hypothetical protein